MRMMEDSRDLRGFILAICKHNYPEGCSLETIDLIVHTNQFATSPAVLKGHVEYLEEKGYVKAQESEALGYSRTIVRITAKGIDLVNGHIPDDPGVLLLQVR